jgi:hypothetical protein
MLIAPNDELTAHAVRSATSIANWVATNAHSIARKGVPLIDAQPASAGEAPGGGPALNILGVRRSDQVRRGPVRYEPQLSVVSVPARRLGIRRQRRAGLLASGEPVGELPVRVPPPLLSRRHPGPTSTTVTPDISHRFSYERTLATGRAAVLVLPRVGPQRVKDLPGKLDRVTAGP